MIKEITIENFKSIKKLSLECRRINILIGEANTGKSNILEAIGLLGFYGFFRMLRNIVKDILKEFVRFFTFDEIFYGKEVSQNSVIQIENTKIELGFKKREGIIKFYQNEKQEDVFSFDIKGNLTGEPRDTPLLPEPFAKFKLYRFKQLEKYEHIEDVNFLLPVSGYNLWSVIKITPKLKNLLIRLMKSEKIEFAFNHEKFTYDFILHINEEPAILSYSSLSDTFKRLIFYLTAIKSNKNSVILFEEPETHSFPAYTHYIAEIIALDKENQYFISTHNPYFLIPIIEKTEADEINIFHVKKQNNQTIAERIDERKIWKMSSEGIDIFFNIEKI